jgi:hypothetical protein
MSRGGYTKGGMSEMSDTRNADILQPHCCQSCRKILILTILNSVVILLAIVSAVIFHLVIGFSNNPSSSEAGPGPGFAAIKEVEQLQDPPSTGSDKIPGDLCTTTKEQQKILKTNTPTTIYPTTSTSGSINTTSTELGEESSYSSSGTVSVIKLYDNTTNHGGISGYK